MWAAKKQDWFMKHFIAVMWHQLLLCHGCLRFSLRVSPLAPQGWLGACNWLVLEPLGSWWDKWRNWRKMFVELVLMAENMQYKFFTKLRRAVSVCRTIFLVLLFSQYARNVHFPLPIYKAKKGWTSYRLQVFKMFPVSTQHAIKVHAHTCCAFCSDYLDDLLTFPMCCKYFFSLQPFP